LSTNEIQALAAPNSPPAINSFTASPTSPNINQTVTFTANALDPNFGDILQYSFNFGDGSTATAFATNNTAHHAYSAPGRYTATVRVFDGIATVSTNVFVIAHYAQTAPLATASSQIIYDSARGKVWCVNPDNDTVSQINATNFAKELEIAVGSKPRSIALEPDGVALWVVCENSDELWVLNPSSGALISKRNLGYGVAPVAVAFAPNDSAAYIAGNGSQSVLQLDLASFATTGSLQLPGPPSSIALVGSSLRMFVSRFI